MKRQLSIITSGLLLTSTLSFAADSIDEAFKTGTVSGDITLYGLSTDNKGGNVDTDAAYGTIGLAYETASYMGLSAKAGFRAGHEFGNSATLGTDAVMTEANIKYATDMFSVTAGRQAIDLEWIGDYNEAVVAEISAVQDTAITLAYVNQQAEADEDTVNEFAEVTEDGLYVLDVKYTGLAGFEFNPYAYSAPDVADYYGLKASYSSDMFGAIAQYVASSEDIGSNGSIGHVEVNGTLAGVSTALGYIKTDDTAGVGSIALYGDNITPFDNGDDNYLVDARTTYGSLGYTIAGVELGVLYGETDFAANSESSELNLTSSYSITDSLSLGLLYVDYDLEGSSASDYKEYSATLAYTF